MTYNVSSGTLNLTHSLTHSLNVLTDVFISRLVAKRGLNKLVTSLTPRKYRTFTCMVFQHLARCMHVVCGCVLGWRSSCLEVWTGTTRSSTLTISSPAFPRTQSVSRPVIQRLNHDHHSGERLPHVNHCKSKVK